MPNYGSPRLVTSARKAFGSCAMLSASIRGYLQLSQAAARVGLRSDDKIAKAEVHLFYHLLAVCVSNVEASPLEVKVHADKVAASAKYALPRRWFGEARQ